MESDSSTVHSVPSEALACPEPVVLRDDMFYFTLVTFKVEDRLFRVLKHKLEEHSHVFRDMFSMPATNHNGLSAEGTRDDNPIRLDMVGKDDFKLLLKLLYVPSETESSLTLDQCITIFNLTRMWGFDDARRIAKDRVRSKHWATVPSVDKIALALEYEFEDWYFDAYYEIVTRGEPLSMEEMRKLDLDLVAKIAKVREKVALARSDSGSISYGVSSQVEGVARDGVNQYLLRVPVSVTPVVRKKKPPKGTRATGFMYPN